MRLQRFVGPAYALSATYSFIFIVVMTAYSIAGVMVFGTDLPNFVDFGTCMTTLLRMLVSRCDGRGSALMGGSLASSTTLL